MFGLIITTLYIALTLIYALMVFVLLGKLEELDPFEYFNIGHDRVEAVALTTVSLWVFSILLFYSYFYSLALSKKEDSDKDNRSA